jgi:hypothetical protein
MDDTESRSFCFRGEFQAPHSLCRSCHGGSAVVYEAAELTTRVRLTASRRNAEGTSSLSMLMSCAINSFINKETEESFSVIQRCIDLEFRRRRDEYLMESVVRAGQLALARYEQNSCGCAVILGLIRYKKCQAEYERSNRIVEQLQQLMANLTSARDYETQARLLEAYDDEVKRIFGMPGNIAREQEHELFDELTSGKVEAYIATILQIQSGSAP